MNFKVGDRVVCISRCPLKTQNSAYRFRCIYGKEYTISKGNHVHWCFENMVAIYEAEGCVWNAKIFRKVEPAQRKTNSITRQLVKDFEEMKEYDPMEIPEHAKTK